LVKTCFESTIPEEFQVSTFLRRGYSVAEPDNIVEVGKVDKGFEINKVVWWWWRGFRV